MPTSATIASTVTIGTITLPITAVIPASGNTLVFTYTAPTAASLTSTGPDPGSVISVAALFTWVSGQLGVTSPTADNLPTALNVSIAISQVTVSTDGTFTVTGQLGSEADGAWSSTYTPLGPVPLTLMNLVFTVAKTAA